MRCQRPTPRGTHRTKNYLASCYLMNPIVGHSLAVSLYLRRMVLHQAPHTCRRMRLPAPRPIVKRRSTSIHRHDQAYYFFRHHRSVHASADAVCTVGLLSRKMRCSATNGSSDDGADAGVSSSRRSNSQRTVDCAANDVVVRSTVRLPIQSKQNCRSTDDGT